MSISNKARTNSNDSTPLAKDNVNDLRNRARQTVLEAVLSLPAEESHAYLEAREKAPIVCKLESDPMMFLRRCDYNVEAAAKRLCFYWKERKDLFRERAHLPMIQTGDGALTREDTLSLRAGWPAILPRSSSGLQVILADRRQSHPRCTLENRLRCVFYVAHIVSQEERAQVEGVIVCSMITTRTGRDPDYEEHSRRGAVIVSHAVPFKALMHFLVDSASGTKKYDIQDALGTVVGHFIEEGATDETVQVCLKREELDFQERFQQLGLKPEGLPKCLGGTWTFTQFTNWCSNQAAKERQVQCMLVELEPFQLQPVNTDTSSSDTSQQAESASKEEASLRAERLAQRRERNLIHSRRKRERRKQELDLIQNNINRLAEERDALNQEAADLERLLIAAKQVVKNCIPDPSN